jgi:protein DGCR14
MEVAEIGKKALAIAERSDERILPPKPRLNVLDEDTYVESLEKIITKDFFPDLPKLQAQAEYLDAVERKDTQKIWELQRRFSTKRSAVTTPSVYSTPATFDTPDGKQPTHTPARVGTDLPNATCSDASADDGPTHNPEPDIDTNKKSMSDTTLDKFLARNTSEDNTSFVEIMKEAEMKHRLKHAWLFDKVDEQLEEKKQYLALPSIEQQALEPPTTSSVQTWTYEPKNAVMYVPDGVPDSPEEKILKAGTAREIVHKNTRFTANPFSADKSQETISQAASALARVQPGRIGPDGKEILPSQSPRVGGYGFVATPSPAPGVDASPLMTWGEIEGTPFRLDGSDTPLLGATRGPTFKIPEVPRRDRLLHQLAEKASKAHRAKREAALKQATASFSSPSPKFGGSKTDRLQFLSPAAQTLASRKLGIRTSTDRALKASYTPSPTHRIPGEKTPTVTTPTPSPGAARTPGKDGVSTPKAAASKRANRDASSLTDNLLNLPKRPKAHDFF